MKVCPGEDKESWAWREGHGPEDTARLSSERVQSHRTDLLRYLGFVRVSPQTILGRADIVTKTKEKGVCG